MKTNKDTSATNEATATSATAIVPSGYFGSVAPAKRPTGSGPLLQWFNALPAGKTLATGWHIQASRCSEELSTVLKGLGVERITVFHRMSGEMVEYWALGTARLIVLCNGFADTWEMKDSQEREGLAYGWIADRQHSKIKVRVLIGELAEAGYCEQFTITLEGMITECFLEALQKQFDVLDAFEKLTGQPAPFWGFTLTMAPAEKPKMVGGKGKQSPIIPMVAVVPASVDEDYLRANVVGQEIIKAIVERDLVSKAVAWSVDVSRRISAGEDREHWESDEEEGSSTADFLGADNEPESHQGNGKGNGRMATPNQLRSIGLLCQNLKREVHTQALTFEAANSLISQMTKDFQAQKRSNGNGSKQQK